MSKSAINGMTRPIARELAKFRIRVLSILPGVFSTPMSDLMQNKTRKKLLNSIPLARFGRPHEFALFVKSLIENDYLTGVNLRLDGGLILGKL